MSNSLRCRRLPGNPVEDALHLLAWGWPALVGFCPAGVLWYVPVLVVSVLAALGASAEKMQGWYARGSSPPQRESKSA